MAEMADNCRAYGPAPYRVAVVHGGPGAAGELAPLARELAGNRGVLEPLQTATSLEGQVEELRRTLKRHAAPPVVLLGHSWGAWLSCILAARYPALVRKLVLVASGPFEARYVAHLQATRLKRLDEAERAEWQAIDRALSEPAAGDKDALLARLGALAARTDSFDPMVDDAESGDRIQGQGDLFQAVWATAAGWRSSGKLLEIAGRIRCPVVAYHGDYDPHPAEGVRGPLAAVVPDFRFVLLEECGHRPWLERQARSGFFEAVRRECT